MKTAPSIDGWLADIPRPVGRESREVVDAVRGYLLEMRAYLELMHRTQKSGRLVNEANSDLTDRMVRRLFALAEESILAGGGELETGVAVVAVGGYARREMSIYSDVDLLVLYRDALTPYVAQVAERLQYWMWDAGLTVGCATRTIEETVALGREDETVRTCVLMARFLCGDGEFFHLFADTIRSRLLSDVEGFVAERREGLGLDTSGTVNPCSYCSRTSRRASARCATTTPRIGPRAARSLPCATSTIGFISVC